MGIKLYCDICESEIKEASEDEGWDTGKLMLGSGIWGEKPKNPDYDLDVICEKCTEEIKNALDWKIAQLMGKL